MKPNKRTLALVTAPATVEPPMPSTLAEKLAAAKEWLGPRHVLSSDYKPRVRVGFYLTAWSAEVARARATQDARPAA